MKVRLHPFGFLVVAAVWSPCATATDFYVSPTGLPSNSGSIDSPWSLPAAVAQPAAVQPGDTIWLRGGTYSGPFVSYLTGTASSPIVLRQYPEERAILDGPADATGGAILTVNGSWTWYWGFEVTCSNPDRRIVRATGINVFGPNTKFINLIVHDTGQGIGFWQSAIDSTIYGSVLYNNGYEGADRGHGHGIYTQNDTGTKFIFDNVIFQSFGLGLQAYSDVGLLNNLNVQGNILFNNGVVSQTGAQYNLLIGGGPVAQNPSVINNASYYARTLAFGSNVLGYASGCNNPVIAGNYFSQPSALEVNCTAVTNFGNTFDGAISGFTLTEFPLNTQFTSPPTGTRVFIRPNAFEPGRANIAVYNWDNNSSLNVDLSGVLQPGDPYEIRDVQDFFGAPVVSGIYPGGVISLPSVLTQVSATVGTLPVPPTHTAPEFNGFVLLRQSAGTQSLTNRAPVIMAGSNQEVALTSSVALSGSAIDDGLPTGALTQAWSKISGPGDVTFSAAASAQTTATFSSLGTYVLQLSASDGVLTSTGTVSVTVVNPADTTAPVLSDVTVSNVTSSSVTISWTTDEAATAEVEYGACQAL